MTAALRRSGSIGGQLCSGSRRRVQDAGRLLPLHCRHTAKIACVRGEFTPDVRCRPRRPSEHLAGSKSFRGWQGWCGGRLTGRLVENHFGTHSKSTTFRGAHAPRTEGCNHDRGPASPPAAGHRCHQQVARARPLGTVAWPHVCDARDGDRPGTRRRRHAAVRNTPFGGVATRLHHQGVPPAMRLLDSPGHTRSPGGLRRVALGQRARHGAGPAPLPWPLLFNRADRDPTRRRVRADEEAQGT